MFSDESCEQPNAAELDMCKTLSSFNNVQEAYLESPWMEAKMGCTQ